MARREDKESRSVHITSPWALRIRNAVKYKKEWENTFKCERLFKYYQGFHWQHLAAYVGRRPATVNLVFSTIKRKIGSIVYSEPQYVASANPGNMDWNQDFAVISAQKKEDTLNTVIANPNLNYSDNIRLAALDSFFRFGVIEPGYAADWRNPQKPHIHMASHDNPEISKDRVIEDEEVLAEESVYAKWISAKRFFVSQSDDPHLRNCRWVGYYSFMSKDVLQNTKGIHFPDKLRDRYYSVDFADASAYYFTMRKEETLSPEVADLLSKGEVCKVWHIWDNVTQERLLLLDGNFEELYATPVERINLVTYRFDLSLDGWYPIPPVWQWLSPQDTVNESIEQMRHYRRRYTRKFEVDKGAFDQDELDKFTNEEDGEILQRKTKSTDGMPGIRAINNPEAGPTITNDLITAKDSFNIVAGTIVARGRGSDRQTATATREQAEDEAIAQSVEQMDFARFQCAIGRELLLQISENFETGVWAKLNSDPGDILQEYQEQQDIYRWISAQELNDGYDFTLKLKIINATPVQQAQEEQAYIKFLTLVNQFPEIRMSPLLIRETAYKVGYKNERIIRTYQQMAMLVMMEKANMAGQSLIAQGLLQPGNAGTVNSAQAQQGMANSQSEIVAQLQNQLG